MAIKVEYLTVELTMTNTTGRYLVVTDYQNILSNHATAEEAKAAHDALFNSPEGLRDTPYSFAHVVAPGKTLSGRISRQVISGEPEELEMSDIFADA